jgi:hypothetical protein
MVPTAVHRLDVHLADQEFGNDLMWLAGQGEFAKHPEIGWLFITVIEHGGWWLQYARDGTIVGTANDTAVLCDRARQYRAETRNCKVQWLPAVYRQEFYSSVTRAIMAARYIVDDSLIGRTFAQYQREGSHPLKSHNQLPEKFRVVGWINKHTFQPVSVIVYTHWNSMEVSVEATDYGRAIDDIEDSAERNRMVEEVDNTAISIQEGLKEFVKDISRNLERQGYDNIEGCTSEEAVADNITANDYLFTASGSRRVTLNADAVLQPAV